MKISYKKPWCSYDSWASGFFKNANSAWESLYYGLNMDGDITSPRGIKIKETLGCNIYIENPMDNLVYNPFRGLSPIYLAKEKAWYDSGDNSVENACKLSKFWGTIANDDGTVNSNYGYYIFGLDPYNVVHETGEFTTMWERTIEILKKDPDSRQAIMQIPINSHRGCKDTPCTSSIQFFIRGKKLFCTVYMRSTDIILGFPIDIFQFTMWQIQMAKELGVGLGWIRFISGNIHCYEKNWLENVKDREFQFCSLEDYKVSDKSSESFFSDLDKLSKGITTGLNDELLSFMVDNKKIWR